MQFISSLLLCFCHCIIPTYLRQLLNAVVCGPRPQLLCAGDRMSVCAHPRRVAGEIPNLFVSVLSFSTAPCSHICHSCHCHHHHHHCHHHTNAVMPSVGVFIAVICLLGSHFRQRHPGWIWLSHQQRHQLQVSTKFIFSSNDATITACTPAQKRFSQFPCLCAQCND